jgi:aldehyde:ferredoxin oxidoreductase
MPTYGGWTGKTLRVDLTTRKSTVENTLEKYKDFWGGTGMAYKVLWDEVKAADTDPYDAKNRLIFGWGPLTGTGAPCGGRTCITSLSPQHVKYAVATGHMGGHFSAEAKYAGWDGIIIQGKASVPVYIAIRDDKVDIVECNENSSPGGKLWGTGIYNATDAIVKQMGGSCQVAAIGQAGENLVAQSVIMTGYSHSAGGQGAVMGAKNLKAIGIVGTGTVKIAADKKAWRSLIDNAMALIGSNNQAVVPNSPQPWSEYVSSARWYGSKGKVWGAANPPVDTGTCEPHDRQSVGLRCFKSDPGLIGEEFTVRMDGCHACPIRCHQALDVPTAAKWGVKTTATNTCTGWWGRGLMDAAKVTANNGVALSKRDADLKGLEAYVVGKHMTDDLGLTNNYGTTDRGWTFIYGTDKGVTWIKPNVLAPEWATLTKAGGLFDMYEKGDLNFIKEFGRIMAYQVGELGKFLAGPVDTGIDSWKNAAGAPLGPVYRADNSVLYWNWGHPKHHSPENGGDVGSLINTGYNRDAQNHSWSSFLGCGLPIGVMRTVAEAEFLRNGYPAGMGTSIDPNNTCTPMNRQKAVAAKWAISRKELMDSTGLCNWMWPWIVSPLKERGYRGDIALESKLFSLATGRTMNTLEFDNEGIKFYTLQRCLTIRTFGSMEMRTLHDQLPAWALIQNHPGKVAFDGTNYYTTQADWDLALDLYYAELGYDKATGAPTRKTLESMGMKDVADELDNLHLLPA